MLGSSFFDPVLGIDVHWEMVPMPAPVPTPIPNPFTGMVFDPMGLLVGMAISGAMSLATGAKFTGPVIYWGFAPANNTGTNAKHIPGHILIPPGTMWAPVPRTPKPTVHPGETPKPAAPVKPENDGVMITGSKTVHVGGTNAVRLGDMVMSCSEPVRLPSSVVLAVPKGAPILIGGPMALDLMAAILASLRTRFMSDSIGALISRMKPSRFRSVLARVACFFTGHPVDVASGRLMTAAVDCDLAGILPLTIERVYNSGFASRKGPLGHGWSHSLDQAVWTERGKVVYLADDGREIEFDTFDLADHRMRPGDEVSHPIDRLTLRCENAQRWTLRTHEGVTYDFAPVAGATDDRARLQRVRARDGRHEIALAYDRRGRLEWVRSASGQVVGLEHDTEGRLVALKLPLPQGQGGWYAHRRYEYDREGDLVRVTDATGATWTFEYVGHLMVRETDRVGLSFYFQFDGLGEDASCVRTWGDGGLFDHALAYDKKGRATFVTNSLGATTQYHMNAAGAVVKVVDPLGAQTVYAYDDCLRRTALTDALGRTSRTTYDERGNKIRVEGIDGTATSVTYDASNQPTHMVDPCGGAWSWRYDLAGRIAEEMTPVGTSTRYEYDDDGTRCAMTRPDGSRTVFEYNAAGLLLGVRGPTGCTIALGRDARGRVVSVRDPYGNVETRQYDVEGRLVRVDAVDGDVWQWTCDPAGRVLAAARGDGRTTRYTYGGFHRLASETHADGTRVTLRYDTEDRLVSVINERGLEHRLERDECGRVRAEIGFDGRRRAYVLDKVGKPTEVTSPSGKATAFAYDDGGRLARVTYGDGAEETFSYRADGCLLEARNDAATVRYERDALGRVVREEQGDHWVASRRDALGRRDELSSSLGARMATLHDLAGFLAGVSVGDVHRPWEMRVSRDVRGREVERTFPGGVSTRWERDAIGRPTAQTLSVAGASLQAHRYEWLPGNRLGAVADAALGVMELSYDVRDRVNGARRTDGSWQYRVADPVSNVYRTPDGSDRVYGPGGELEVADGVVHRYDPDGQLVARELPDGARWTYAWDGAGRLREVTRPDGVHTTFAYDALGRRVSKQVGDRETRWVWDADVVLHEIRSDAPMATWFFEPGGFTPLAKTEGSARFGVVVDRLGVPTAMVDEAGAIAWQAQLDLYGVPVGAASRTACPWRFPGQYDDEDVGLFYNRHRYYDPVAGRYISRDPLGLAAGLSAYAYVGDPFRDLDPFGLIVLTPVPYNDHPLFDAVKEHVGDTPARDLKGRNVAAVLLDDGTTMAAHSTGGGNHAETNLLAQMEKEGVDPARVVAAYTERAPCTGRTNCNQALDEALGKDVPVYYTHEMVKGEEGKTAQAIERERNEFCRQ